MENLLLEVKQIDVFYGDVQAIANVSVEVEKGAIVALVGANGAGKSTLLKTIAGVKQPSKGDILFQNQPLCGLRAEQVANMGIVLVPEGRGLFAGLTVLENLKLGAYPTKARAHLHESLDHAFELFPVLKERVGQKAGALSGGQQQMLAIARAVMAMPDLLMLDEPSLGLSPLIAKEIFGLIRTLNEQGTTVLLVEQNVNQALKIAHNAYVLKTGNIEMQGTGQELLSKPEVQEAYIGKRWSKK